MNPRPKVLHFSSVLGLGGTNRAMSTMIATAAQRGPAHVMLLAEGKTADFVRQTGATVYTAYDFDQSRWPGLSKLGRIRHTIRRLRQVAKELDIDIIHAHNANGAKYWIPALRGLGVKKVSHQRDNYERNLFHLGLGRADHIITVSEWIRRGLPARLQAKATAIHDAVEIPDAQAPVRPADWKVTIGMAGGNQPKKGHDLFVDAALQLAARHDIRVVIWGLEKDGPEYDRTQLAKVAAASPEVQQRFDIHPARPDMETFYDSVDVVAIPSRFPDPFPRMVTESMAHHKAVVVANHGGMIEIARHEQTGLVFQPGNADDLATQLERLIVDEALRRSLSRAGRRAVVEELSADRYADAVEGIYAKVLNSR